MGPAEINLCMASSRVRKAESPSCSINAFSRCFVLSDGIWLSIYVSKRLASAPPNSLVRRAASSFPSAPKANPQKPSTVATVMEMAYRPSDMRESSRICNQGRYSTYTARAEFAMTIGGNPLHLAQLQSDATTARADDCFGEV